MTSRDVDRLLTAWLAADAPANEPDLLLERVLARTSTTRRRPGWSIPERWLSVQLTMRWRTAPSLAPIVLLLVAVTALVVAALIAGANPRLPAPFGVAANGRIIYSVDGTLFQTASLDVAGSALPAGTGADFAPQPSLDGTRLAFWRMVDPLTDRMALWVSRIDGSGQRLLGEFTTLDWFAWSPDGRSIAVSTGTRQATDLSIVEVADGRTRTIEAGLAVGQPAWRPPDGGQLAIRRKDDLDPLDAWGLSLVAPDGRLIADLALDDGFRSDPFYDENVDYYFLSPSWSPDGRRLAFHTLEPTVMDPDPGWRVHVVEVGVDGAVLSERVLDPGRALDDEFDATWLPDGRALVTHRTDEGSHSLAIVPVDGTSEPHVFDFGRLPGFSFVVSPDGREILVWSGDAGTAWRIDVAGGESVPVSVTVHDLAWQRTSP